MKPHINNMKPRTFQGGNVVSRGRHRFHHRMVWFHVNPFLQWNFINEHKHMMFYDVFLYIFWYSICCIIVLGQSLPPLAQSLNDAYGFDKWNLIVDQSWTIRTGFYHQDWASWLSCRLGLDHKILVYWLYDRI